MNRRKFICAGSTVAFAAALPVRARAERAGIERSQDKAPVIGSPEIKELALKALDAARSNGASYADVQLRSTRLEFWLGGNSGPLNRLVAAAGVRALSNGYWGFSAFDGPVTPDGMAKLGREAAAQAKTGALGKARTVSLSPTPVVADGTWVTPIEIDPFAVDVSEKSDFLRSIDDFYSRTARGINAMMAMRFMRDERTFASSDGTFTSQTIYTTAGGVQVAAEPHFRTEIPGRFSSDFPEPAGAGWEYIITAPFRERADELIEHARRARTPKPVDVGRYDIVFDAHAMAQVLDATIGAATNVERALGYRANSEGTSFLDAPLDMLGSYKMGSSLVNVTANRSMKGGAATVRWDNEGVEPAEITLVKDGILADFQTGRESASWLEPYLSRTGKPVRSNGCSGSDAATTPQGITSANLVLEPGKQSDTFESMVAGTKKGMAVIGGRVTADHQCLNGAGNGSIVYEIVNGKLGEAIGGVSYLFRAPEFWRNVVAIGSSKSARTYGFTRQPQYPTLGMTLETSSHSVVSVPAKVNQLAVVDVMRKA